MRTFLLTLFLLLGIYCPDSSAQEIGKGGNNAISIRNVQDVTDAKYSIQQDQSGFCRYTEVTDNGQTYKALDINPVMFDHNSILMGVSDPSRCPLPGTDFLPDGYPEALAGEFILSGVICVVQSIIMDSMFRIYCTILLWFYQILYAMLVIYMMFYGLAVMFNLTDEPIREIPRRIIILLFVFFFAVNAEVGFKWVYQTFTSVLTTFSDILTRIQPLYTEGGERVYDNEGRLLDEQGNVWKPMASGTEFLLINPWTVLEPVSHPDYGKVVESTFTYSLGTSGIQVPTSMTLKDGSTHNFETIPADQAVKYVPFRVPAQQWQGRVEGTEYKVYPVFEQLADPEDMETHGFTACVLDLKYDDAKKKLVAYPRCNSKNWPTIPKFAPYAATINKNLNQQGEEGLYESIGTTYEPVLGGGIGNTPTPPKLLDQQGNVTTACNEAANPESCRKPFQGILGKIDALFDTVVGDDRSKGLTSMAIALGLLTTIKGGGTALSIFLMTGILTMFVAFIQILWVYVTAMMGLTFLMMLAPIFISFKLFKITEKMFTSWVSMLVSFMWQPVIVLGFVYVLSNATTLDRLTYIAKNELGTKRYEASKASGTVKAGFTAPGFLEPLYNKPADYDRQVGTKGNQYKGLANIEGDFISRAQRDLYLQEKGRYLANYYALILSGRTENESRTGGYKDDVMADINNHPEAVDFINLYTQPQKFTIAGTTPVNGYTGTVTLKGIEALHMYSAQNNLPAGYQITITEINTFLDKYRAEIGLDDHDAFVGEPINAATPTNPIGETPICAKYCPAFDPPYDPANAATINPTHQQCKAFCLYTFKGKEEMFSYIVGALIIWIILNAMTGAFMSKIPALAEALSRIYGIESPKIFGASKTIREMENPNFKYGTGWATNMTSDFANLGGIFDTGIASGRPGAIAKITDRLQQLANRTEIVGADGIPVSRDGASMYEESLLSILGVKRDPKVAAYYAIGLIQGSNTLHTFKSKDGKNTTTTLSEAELLKYGKGYENGKIRYNEMEAEIVKEIINKDKTKHWTKEDIKKAYIEYLKGQYARHNGLDIVDAGGAAGTRKAISGTSSGPTSVQEDIVSVTPSRPENYGTAIRRGANTDDDLTKLGRGEEAYTAITTPALDVTTTPDQGRYISADQIDRDLTASVDMLREEPSSPYAQSAWDVQPMTASQYAEYLKQQEQAKQSELAINTQPVTPENGGNISTPQQQASPINTGTNISAQAIVKTGENLMSLAAKLDPGRAENKQTIAALNNLKAVVKTGDLKKIMPALKDFSEQAKELSIKEKLFDVDDASRIAIADENLMRKTKEDDEISKKSEEDLKKQEQEIADEKLLRERTERENLERIALEEQDNLRRREQEELARLEQITLEQVRVERNREPVLAETERSQNEPLIEQVLQAQQRPEEQTVQATQPQVNQTEIPSDQPKPVEVTQNISENVVASVNPPAQQPVVQIPVPIQPAKPVSPLTPLFPIQAKKPDSVKSEKQPEPVSILKTKQEFIVNLGTNSREQITASTSTNNERQRSTRSAEEPATTENPRTREETLNTTMEQVTVSARQQSDDPIIQPIPQPALQPVFSQTAKSVSSGLTNPFSFLTGKEKEEQKPASVSNSTTSDEESESAVSREAITAPSYQQTQQVDIDAVEITRYFDALGIQTPNIPDIETPKKEQQKEEETPPQPTTLVTDSSSNFGFGSDPTEIKTNPEQSQTPWGWNDGQKAENEKMVSDYLSSQPKTLTESVNEMLSNNQKAEEKRAEELAKEQKNEHAKTQKDAPDAAEIYNEAMQRLKLSGDITNSDVYAEAMVIAAGGSGADKDELVRKVIDAVNARMQSVKQAEKKQEAYVEAKAEKANPIVNPKNKLKNNNNEGSG